MHTRLVVRLLGLPLAALLFLSALTACGGGGGGTTTLVWTATGDLQALRRDHVAVRLLDGRVLLVGGGADPRGEVYDPASGTFASTNPMPVFHGSGLSGTLMDDGQVLIVGGGGSGRGDASLYDPATNAFTSLGVVLKTPRAYHAAVKLTDGRVLILGGHDAQGTALADVEVYNPIPQTLSTRASLATARRQARAALLPNGEVLVCGGYGTARLASVERYDPTLNTWSAAAPMHKAGVPWSLTPLPGGDLLVNVDADLERYHAALGTWTQVGTLTGRIAGAMASPMADGRVVFAGGAAALGPVVTAAVEIFNPDFNLLYPGPSMGVRRQEATLTLLLSGKLLVAGGLQDKNGGFPELGSAELLGPP